MDRFEVLSSDAGSDAQGLHLVDTSAYLVLSTTRLPSALREALGPPAAEDLVTIVDELRAERAEFRAEFAEFRREVNARFQALETRLGEVKADLIKWSFVFWVGAVTAIAMLAGVLDR